MSKWVWGLLLLLAAFLLNISVQLANTVASSQYNGMKLVEISGKMDQLTEKVDEDRGRIIRLESQGGR